jgi:DNA-binding GntR family transcriptional regulator
VVSEDQRGFRVASVSTEDLIDLTRLRQKLEGMALRMAIENGDDDWEAELVSAFHRLSKAPLRDPDEPRFLSEAWEARHRAFHRTLVSACGSPRLLHLRDTLYDQSDRYRRLAVASKYDERDIFAEHKGIFEAAIRRDADAACRLLEAHLDLTARIVLQAQEEA